MSFNFQFHIVITVSDQDYVRIVKHDTLV